MKHITLLLSTTGAPTGVSESATPTLWQLYKAAHFYRHLTINTLRTTTVHLGVICLPSTLLPYPNSFLDKEQLVVAAIYALDDSIRKKEYLMILELRYTFAKLFWLEPKLPNLKCSTLEQNHKRSSEGFQCDKDLRQIETDHSFLSDWLEPVHLSRLFTELIHGHLTEFVILIKFNMSWYGTSSGSMFWSWKLLSKATHETVNAHGM